jgi:uncharacterized membrane protein YccC
MYLNLDRPYWAMATAYIVAQPLTGAMRSKAAYRFAGTAAGAVVTLILVPNLVNAPILMVGALGLWIAICICVAVLDRTPRAYVFLLAGYTAAIVGFSAVDTPGDIWALVLARVEEIALGILCTTLIGTLILPRPLGPALAARVDSLSRQAASASVALLSGMPDTAASRAARRQLAADAVEVAALVSHLAYDTSNLQSATRPITFIQQRIVLLLPVLSGIADRIAALREAGGMTQALRDVLDRVSAWIGSAPDAVAGAADLHRAIAALEPQAHQPDWTTIMRQGLLARLHELVDIGNDIAALRHQLDRQGDHLPDLAVALPDRLPKYRDHLMAAYSGAAAFLAVGLVCVAWIGTAWPDGAGAAGLTAVACSFFAAQDDPVPSIVKFLYGAIVALLLDALYLFAILPVAQGFTMLTLALAPAYLLLGVLMAQPASAAIFGPIAFMSATLMTITASYAADFAAYVNGALAAIAGLAAAAIVLRLVRSVGAAFAARRLLRANRAEIAACASHAGARDRLGFASLMLDRLTEIVPRMAASAEGADGAARAALADIRVGINVVDLQRVTAALPGAGLDAVLAGIAAHFRTPLGRPPDPILLADIDRAIGLSAAPDAPQGGAILLALVGIRRALFRDAPPFAPHPTPLPALRQAA